MRLNELTIEQAQAGLRKKKFTSVELTQACLDSIAQKNKELNAVLTVCADEALVEARAADERLASGEDMPLTGIPYIAKDNYLTRGVRTTAASKMLEHYIAPYDATVIAKLREQGAVLLGKANLDEFAHGSSTENSAFGVVKNPHDPTRVPGGSSGGSAAAVAAHMCLFALGTDTGGSIRHPAAFCGIVGLKPTYGRGSRFGLVAMTSSTDVPGPLTKTVADAAMVQAAISGLDPHDFTTVDEPVPDYQTEMQTSLKGVRVGVPQEFFVEGVNEQIQKSVRAAIADLEKQGAIVSEVSLPHTKYALAVYYILTPSEVSSNLGRHDGIRYGFSEHKDAKSITDVYVQSRGRGFGAESKRRIMIGTYALSSGYYDAYYLQAQKVRTIIIRELDQVFKEVDVLVTPSAPNVAFKISSHADPLSMYLEDILFISASVAGLPAISVPCGAVDGLPVGAQVIGKKFDEARLFQVAQHIHARYA